MQTTVVMVGDIHAGSTVALCKPIINLDDGGTYHASKAQKWLWGCWQDLLEQVDKKKLDKLYTVVNGDAAEGDYKNRSKQLITRNKANILTIASDPLAPLAQMSTGMLFMRGTPAHVGKSAELEEELAGDFDNTIPCPETGAKSWYWLPYRCEGVLMDIAHHPPGGGGGRPYTRFSFIDRLASDTVFSYANDRREQPPALVIRSHIHQYRDSYDHFITRAITLPAWTIATEFINKINPGALADIGALIVQCSAGHYEAEIIRYQPAKGRYFTP